MTQVRNRSIGAAVLAAQGLQGHRKEVALLEIDELRLAREFQAVAASGLPVECDMLDAWVGEGDARRPNPDRPYLTGNCCETHTDLRDRKAALVARAAELGVVDFVFDAFTPVTD